MGSSLIIPDDPTPEDRAIIAAPLAEYNGRSGPPSNAQSVAILLGGEDGTPCGGLWGHIAHDWLFIELLAVPLHMRGQNHGATLMTKAEEIAQERGCVGVWLDTYAFQARGFYEKLGYSLFGTIRDHPIGSARYFLSKRFTTSAT